MHYLNYEEHRRHGTDDFPLKYYLVDEQHPRYNMPYHWHRETEGENAGIRVLFTKEQPGILKCASRMFAAAKTRKEGWELLVLAGLFDFYGTVIQQKYYDQDGPAEHAYNQMQSIKAALEYIAMNYQNPLTLEELARITGQSPKYFCRCFRMAVHRTPIDYLNYYRVERACYLLEQKSRSVTQIAYECGFNDCSYFIRCFKKYKGITPNQYARDVQNCKYTDPSDT